jgi:hypothetical protein
MARLAWRATKFFARTGFNLALSRARRSVDRAQNRDKDDVKNETIDGDYSVPSEVVNKLPPQPARLNDWRVYSQPSPHADKPDQERIRWGKKS